MLFVPKTATAIHLSDPDNGTFSTSSDYDGASTCLAFEAVRYCAMNRQSGVSILYIPTAELANSHVSKAQITCTGQVNQELLVAALNSNC